MSKGLTGATGSMRGDDFEQRENVSRPTRVRRVTEDLEGGAIHTGNINSISINETANNLQNKISQLIFTFQNEIMPNMSQLSPQERNSLISTIDKLNRSFDELYLKPSNSKMSPYEFVLSNVSNGYQLMTDLRDNFETLVANITALLQTSNNISSIRS
jgi:hypothetical protein